MRLTKFLEKNKSNLKSFAYPLIFIILYLFIAIFVLLLFPILVSRDYELLIRVAEFAIIGSGTLTILTFTYAQAKGVDDGKYSDIVHSGELLLKSTLTIVIGLGFLPGVGYMIRNPSAISSSLGIFAGIYDALLALTTLFILIILIIGIISLILSAAFFALGITKLIELF